MSRKVPSHIDIFNPETGEHKRVHRVDGYDWLELGWQLTPPASPEEAEDPAPAPRQSRTRKLQAVLEEG